MGDPIVSFAQNFEDIVLWRCFKEIDRGFYVDVGAAHPLDDSVTQIFYEAGWSGINIEPTHALANELRSHRSRDTVIECAVGTTAGQIKLFEVPGTGLSTVKTRFAERARHLHGEPVERQVTMRTLSSILEEHVAEDQPIHFMKVDVEGSEHDVLSSSDWKKWRPWVVLIEATEPNSIVRTDGEWRKILEDEGYRTTLFDGLNVFLVSPEHPELHAALSYPICVFDHPFLLRSQADLIDQTVSEISRISGLYNEAIEEISRMTSLYDKAIHDWQKIHTMYVMSNERVEELQTLLETSQTECNALRVKSESLKKSATARLWQRITRRDQPLIEPLAE